MQVQEPEQRHSSHVLTRRTLEASETAYPPTVNASDSGDQDIEAPGRRHESTLDELRPPLGVKLTGYRLLNTGVVFTFGTTRAILTYMGRSAMPTTLDWIGGTFLGVFLYWIGLYEPVCSKKWEWFFKAELTRAICYWVLRVMGKGTDCRLQDPAVCTHDPQVSEETYSTTSGLDPSLQSTLVRGHDEGAGISRPDNISSLPTLLESEGFRAILDEIATSSLLEGGTRNNPIQYRITRNKRVEAPLRSPKQFACNTCGQRFSQQQGVNRHHREKHAEPSLCIYCGAECGRPYLYRRHIKNHHPEIDPDSALGKLPGSRRTTTFITSSH